MALLCVAALLFVYVVPEGARGELLDAVRAWNEFDQGGESC